MDTAVTIVFSLLTAAAGRTTGTLHTAQHKSLSFVKVNAGVDQHGIRPLLKKYSQSIQFKGRIAANGFFGYVHSQ